MKTIQKWAVGFVCCCILLNFSSHVFSDDREDDDKRKGRHREQSKHDDEHGEYKDKYLAPVNNETYKDNCGVCHFAYQPGLLPSGSWGKILSGLPAHFGEEVALDQEPRKVIAQYLKENSAERSRAKRAVKILRSLKGRTPLRITDTPYIREKHHEIPPSVFSREAIGFRGNCPACHTTADKGIYKDDFARIPE